MVHTEMGTAMTWRRALRARFWEIASDLTLGLSGWAARRYAAAVNEQARRVAGEL